MKKEIITTVVMLLIGFLGFTQSKYLTKTGTVTFEASVPSFEEVKAKTESTTAILNTTNGEFAALVFVKGFRFKNALMEEHFNENYAESDDYPKATFKGTLSGFDVNNVSETKKKISYKGSLTFHGKTKVLTSQQLTMSLTDDTITLEGEFEVNTDDFGINIPKVVSNKLSKTVDVAFSFALKKK